MRNIKLIREFVDSIDTSVIDLKMEELNDLISNFSDDNNLMYRWENKNNEELIINFLFNDLSIRYEFDIKGMFISKITNDQLDFTEEIESIDEALDIIEKDVYNILGVGEKNKNNDMKKFKHLRVFENFDPSDDLSVNELPGEISDLIDLEDRGIEPYEGGEPFEGDDYDRELERNLSIELEYILRTVSEDDLTTIDDFLEQQGIAPEEMTGFAWAAIVKGTEEFQDMTDDEFMEFYNEHNKDFGTDEQDIQGDVAEGDIDKMEDISDDAFESVRKYIRRF